MIIFIKIIYCYDDFFTYPYYSIVIQVHVAIVTAAGYPGDASRFEERVAGLLAAFKRRRLSPAVTNR